MNIRQHKRWVEIFSFHNYLVMFCQVASAITSMVVRGAPAIGITAAYGMAIAQKTGEDMAEAYRVLAASRPTAVNLKWALDRVCM